MRGVETRNPKPWWGSGASLFGGLTRTRIVEDLMEKNMDHEMKAGFRVWGLGFWVRCYRLIRFRAQALRLGIGCRH